MNSLQRNRGKVRRFQRLLRIAGWIADLPNRVTPPPFRLMQMSSAFWQSRALHAAAALGIADALGEGERSTAALAAELGLHEDHLYRLLRMLASNGVFRETAPRTFGNSKLSAPLRRDHPQSVRALVLMHNAPEMTRPWTEQLLPCLRSGAVPFAEANGAELFAYMDGDAAFDGLFAEAMDAVAALTGDAYLEDFDWSRFRRIIDVGGSRGSKSQAILRRHPTLRAVVFDRAQVIDPARAAWQQQPDAALRERLAFESGDMLASLPEARDGDLYLFVAVFHGLGEPEARTLLANLRRAIGGREARAVVVDALVPERGIDAGTAAFDLQMLMGTRGRERTEAEWRALFDPAGFALREVVALRTFARALLLEPV